MCLLIYQQTSAIKTLFILKMVSFESLARNDSSERGAQAEAHCERNLIRQNEVLDEKYRIAVQGIFVGIIKKASGAGLKIKQESWCPRSLTVCCLLISIN